MVGGVEQKGGKGLRWWVFDLRYTETTEHCLCLIQISLDPFNCFLIVLMGLEKKLKS